MHTVLVDPLPRSDRLAFALMRVGEHVLGNNLLRRPSLRGWYEAGKRSVDHRLERRYACKGRGVQLTMDRRPDLRPEEFRDYYVRHALPVVIPGAAERWACVEKWSPEFFAEAYGSDRVVLVNNDIATDESIEEETTLAAAISTLGSGEFKYARFVPLFHNHPELLDEFDREWLGAMIDGGGTLRLYGSHGRGAGVRSHLFIGERGAKTNLHCALTNNLFVNIHGRKRWFIISPLYDPALESPVNRGPGVFGSEFDPSDPDFEAFPMCRYLDWYEVTLEPGDVLYNPPFYWHHVTNVTDNVSVGVRWYRFRDAMRAAPLQNLLSLIATNPTMWSAARNAIEYGDTHGDKKRHDLR
jgi:hypothetical protein